MSAKFSKMRKVRRACAGAGIVVAMLATGCAQVSENSNSKPMEIPVFPPLPETPRLIWERTLHSSADVTPDEKEGGFRRMVTGEVRTGEGMAKPYGVAVRNGRVYVGDTVGRSVVLFDLNRKRHSRIGIEDPGSLRMPFGIDIDSQDNVYVLDGTLKRVHVYDANGKFLRMIGQGMKWSRPAGLALDEARSRIYIVDAGGVDSQDHHVRALDLKTGNLLFEIGKRGDGPGEFNLPRDAVVGADGLPIADVKRTPYSVSPALWRASDGLA